MEEEERFIFLERTGVAKLKNLKPPLTCKFFQFANNEEQRKDVGCFYFEAITIEQLESKIKELNADFIHIYAFNPFGLTK